MKFIVRPKLQIAFAILATLAVYFPTISHKFSRFDDPFILEHYGINSTLTITDILRPGSGFYYRPLVDLSYWLDSWLWGQDPSFMHLENIAAHLVNVFLVFLIASRLPGASGGKCLPLLSALLFGLHPINTEPVNWIAGRTDLFAGIFIFWGFYCTIRAIQEQSKLLALSAFFIFLAGTLAKETAMMFVAAVLLLSLSWPINPEHDSTYKAWRTRFLLLPISALSCLVVFILSFSYLKRHGDNAVSMISSGGFDPLTRTAAAVGLYAKKVFLPLPLNAAIVDVNPLYGIVGISAVFAIIFIWWRFRIPGILFVIAGFFLFPALIVAAVPIAWTPYGERYLYIPSAFVVMGVLEFSHCCLGRKKAASFLVPVAIVVVLLAFIATMKRGNVWGDNLVLLDDIITKSPSFGVARNEYGVLLKEKGFFPEAQQQFEIALQQKNPQNVDRIIRLNLIGMKLQGKRPDERRQILLAEMGQKIRADYELLQELYRCDEYALHKASSLNDRKTIVAGMLETNDILYRRTGEAHYLYRSGQLALSVGDRHRAVEYFRKSSEKAPRGAFYREPALKLAEKLGAE